MRRTIPLTHPRHKPPQALARVKNQLRKYFKRERGKELPEDADYWHFDCKVGADEDSAEACTPDAVVRRVDALAQEGVESVYVEILARPATRAARPPAD